MWKNWSNTVGWALALVLTFISFFLIGGLHALYQVYELQLESFNQKIASTPTDNQPDEKPTPKSLPGTNGLKFTVSYSGTNPNLAVYGINTSLPKETGDSLIDRHNNPSNLFVQLRALPGIVNVRIYDRYSIDFVKGDAFEWKDIEGAIARTLASNLKGHKPDIEPPKLKR